MQQYGTTYKNDGTTLKSDGKDIQQLLKQHTILMEQQPNILTKIKEPFD